MRVIREEKLAERALELGNWFMDELRKLDSPYIEEVRGRGLMVGAVVKREHGTARPFCEALMKRGVLAKETHEQVVRFAPPLVVSREDLGWALEQVREVFSAVSNVA